MVQLVVHRGMEWYSLRYTGVQDGTRDGTDTSSGAPGSIYGYTQRIQADLGYGGAGRGILLRRRWMADAG